MSKKTQVIKDIAPSIIHQYPDLVEIVGSCIPRRGKYNI